MNSKTREAINRIQELQFTFSKQLTSRITELNQASQDLDKQHPPCNKNNKEHLQKTHDLAHKLAGSAGTFQFTEVYNQAKNLENLCNRLLDAEKSFPKDWHSQIQQLLIEITLASTNKKQSLSPQKNALSSSDQFLSKNTQSNNIILVDDDELVAALIQEQARHFGYEINCITNPEELSALLDKESPEIILMDIVFPQHSFSGVDLVRQLKAEKKITCPVIFLSNKEDFNARLEALRAGGNGYIVKPVNILELIEVFDRHLHKKLDNKYKALIIDDDTFSSEYYSHILEQHQFDCIAISHPQKSTEILLDFKPDIILLDINMPDCDGFETAEVIRQDNRFTQIPILFLTADNEKEREVEALQAGGDYVFNKSSDLEPFIANVISHSQRSKELHTVIDRLRINETRFQAVSNSSTDAIITLDRKGHIILWNQGAENIFGYQSLEVIGHSIEIIIPEKFQKQHRKGFEKLVTKKAPLTKHSIESQAITKDHKLIAIELTYTEWAAGDELFFTSIIRNISHRKEVENELKIQQENLKAIVKNSAEGIITIDKRGCIEMVNPKAQEIFCYQADELKGQNISILMPKEMRHQHQQYINHSEIHSPKIINKARELQGLRKDGSLFPMELNVSPMTINGVKKYVGILHDITERKNALDLITAAKSDAEFANKAKSQFLSSMSHELRTPLNAILGFTQILQEDKGTSLNEDQGESLDHIYTAGKHLLHLIDEVLDLSKVEHGEVNVNLETINLTKQIHQALILLKPQAQKTNIQFESSLHLDPDLFVKADSFRLNQVISNLLTNAIKYNKPNGLVTIWLTQTDDRIRLYVKDTGNGIPDELMENLFKPFNRLGAEHSGIEGTGIGLTITKMLVEIMGGRIGVENSYGKGCSFWVELEKSQPSMDTLPVASRCNLTSELQQSSATNILYIEDNSANRQLMKKIIINRTNFQYSEAVNAKEGIQAAINNNPHIILLDLNLPDMNGFEVFEQLQNNNISKKTKIIVISANAMSEDISKGQNKGFFDYITKPIDQHQLLSSLDRALKEI